MKTKEEFNKFHEENPNVYTMFKYFTNKVVSAGLKKCSVELIWNQIRWYATIEVKTLDPFKLNNDYKAWYSRKYMSENPDRSDLFNTRSSLADH